MATAILQGAAIHPETGKLWESEFGPQGGDEINIPQAGEELWLAGCLAGAAIMTAGRFPDPPTHPEFADAIYHWNPVISPSGITFYTGDAIPAWKGNLLIAGLSSEAIVRLTLDGEKVKAEERDSDGRPHPRRRAGPDGSVYALTDEGTARSCGLRSKNRPNGAPVVRLASRGLSIRGL